MSLAPFHYSSRDPGAPVLSGVPGSLANLLDAVLVTGYGSGENFKHPIGWTREFSSGQIRVYRGDPVEGSGYYLRVDDSAQFGNARYAWVRAFESMSDVNSGVGGIPEVSQSNNGMLWAKSRLLNASPIAWHLIGNSRALYFAVSAHADVARTAVYFAGDIISFIAADRSNFALTGAMDNEFTGSDVAVLSGLLRGIDLASGAFSGNTVVAASKDGVRSQRVSVIGDWFTGGSVGAAGVPFPDPVGKGLLVNKISIKEGANLIRGNLPGAFAPLHDRPYSHGDAVFSPGVIGMDEGVALAHASFNIGTTANHGMVIVSLNEKGWL